MIDPRASDDDVLSFASGAGAVALASGICVVLQREGSHLSGHAHRSDRSSKSESHLRNILRARETRSETRSMGQA